MGSRTLENYQVDLISNLKAANARTYKNDMRSAETATKRVDSETKNFNATGNRLSETLRNMSRNVAILEGPLGGTAGRLSTLATATAQLNPLLVAAGLGMAGLSAAAGSGVREFAKYESQIFRIEQLTRTTGYAAGFTAEQISAMADRIGRDTLASANGIRDAAGVLLTFKAISGQQYKQTLELSQDLAAVMGIDAKNAALQLAKALEDPANGLTALRRSGVSFTNSERDLIKTLHESGDVIAAQTLILKKLEEQVGGAGAAEGKGTAGAIDLFAENWSRLMRVFAEESGAAKTVESIFNNIGKGAGIAADYLGRVSANQSQYGITQKDIEEQGIIEAEVDQNAAFDKSLELLFQARNTSSPNAQLNYVGQRNQALEELEASNQVVMEHYAQRAAEHEEFLEQKHQRDQLADQKDFERMLDSMQREERAMAKHHRIMERNEQKLRERELKAQEKFRNQLQSMQMQGIATMASAIRAFSEQGSAIYAAVTLIEKGNAAVRIVANSNAAAARALAELGPVAGPPMAARIKFWGYTTAAATLALGVGQAFAGTPDIDSSGSAGSTSVYNDSLFSAANDETTTHDTSDQFDEFYGRNGASKIQIDINVHGDINDSDRFTEKVAEAVRDATQRGEVLIETNTIQGQKFAA